MPTSKSRLIGYAGVLLSINLALSFAAPSPPDATAGKDYRPVSGTGSIKPGSVPLGPAMSRALHYGGRHAVRDLGGLLHVTWVAPNYQFHYYARSLDTLGWTWTEPINPMEAAGMIVERALMAQMAIDPVSGYLYMMPFYRLNSGERYRTGISRSMDGGLTWSPYMDLNERLGRAAEEVSWGTFTIGPDQVMHIVYSQDNYHIMYTRADLTDNDDLDSLIFTRADGVTPGDESIVTTPSGIVFQGAVVLDRNGDPHVLAAGDGFEIPWDLTPYHIYYRSSIKSWGPLVQLIDEIEVIEGVPEMVFDANNRGYYFLDHSDGYFVFGTWEPPTDDTTGFGTLNNSGLSDGTGGAVVLTQTNYPSLEISIDDNLYFPNADVDDAKDIVYLVANTGGYYSGRGGDIIILALYGATTFAGQDPSHMPWEVYRRVTLDSIGNVGADVVYNPASSQLDIFWSAAGDSTNQAWYTDASRPLPQFDAWALEVFLDSLHHTDGVTVGDTIDIYGIFGNGTEAVQAPFPVNILILNVNGVELYQDENSVPPIAGWGESPPLNLTSWIVPPDGQPYTIIVTTAQPGDQLPPNNSVSMEFAVRPGTNTTRPRPEIPSAFSLHQNYPNPFNPSTTLEFALPAALPVSLVVYDLRGRQVATLLDRRLEPGHHRATWDGRDATGRVVPSGIYLARLHAPGYSATRKMLLLK